MKNSTKNQKGSETRDYFKLLHKKELSSAFYALDSDLELVEKKPQPFIVARVDFKLKNDSISFAEVIAYNQLVEMPEPWKVPVYIIEALPPFVGVEPTEHRFTVYRYVHGDWRPDPPSVKLELVGKDLTWEGLGAWEKELRKQRCLTKMKGR